jgi:hypothetical protein
MTETDKIQERFEMGYTMAVYGTREAIHKQMWEDIRVLLCENKALSITAVSFELPKDNIFQKSKVELNNPLEKFYYYHRPAYCKQEQEDFRKTLQEALDFLKGN